jgi:hypothetical protein
MATKSFVFALILALMPASPALAGPPLICHPQQIGSAPSLPWASQASGWNGMLTSYDVSRLVPDTLRLLASAPGPDVRMETLRRAALYSTRDPGQADVLARRLFAQRAWFEAGYFVEAVREAAQVISRMQDPARRAVWRMTAPPPYIAGVLSGRIDPTR